MRLLGFTADATLYKARHPYLVRTLMQVGGGHVFFVPQRSVVCDIGFEHCLDRCDEIGRFDDTGDLWDLCTRYCLESNDACEGIFSPSPSTL